MTNVNNHPLVGCILILHHGKFLGVSRRDDETKWGVPGGKAEAGETSAQAAARECLEETGVVPEGLRLIYEGDCGPGSDGRDFFASTYLAARYHGTPKQMGEGKVGWIDDQDLLCGPFADYNSRMLTVLRKHLSELDETPTST